jgi:predicted MFS family arabinose efflux permease
VIFEIPANVLMKKFTPHTWLAGNMVLFGFTTVMQGLVKNYAGLLATRFFLGVFGKLYAYRSKASSLNLLDFLHGCGFKELK